MIVVVAGIKRSGTTFISNVVRIALQDSGTVTGSGKNIPDRTGDHHIIKVHPFDKRIAGMADLIITSDRRGPDILRSLNRVFPGERDMNYIERLKKELRKWKARSDLHLHFDHMKKRPLDQVGRILWSLDEDPTKAPRILREVRSIEPPKKGHDPETFLFPGHISEEGRI